MNWLERLFNKKPYEYRGSSEEFKIKYTEVEKAFKVKPFNAELVLLELDHLAHMMRTRGDGNIIEKLQSQYRLNKYKV